MPLDLNDKAVITPSRGFIFTAPVGTEAPTPAEISAFNPDEEATYFSGWDVIGHTARDELPQFGFDGGDTEARGTWQNANLREVVTEVAADYVTFNVHNFDQIGLGYYYGVEDPGTTPGRFDVQDAPTKGLERALLIVIMDGDVNIAFYAPKVSIRREDAIELDVENLAYLPLRATILKLTGSPLMSWISEDTGVNIS